MGTGQRGAFLVTGHRGAGKTSFVHHCLSEHREAVFERFLVSNVGKTMLWDRVVIAALVALAAFGALTVRRLAEFALAANLSAPWVGVALIPLSLIALYPLFWTRDVLRMLLAQGRGRPRHPEAGLDVVATLLLAFLCGFAWIAGDFAAGALSLSRIALCGSIIFVLVELRDAWGLVSPPAATPSVPNAGVPPEITPPSDGLATPTGGAVNVPSNLSLSPTKTRPLSGLRKPLRLLLLGLLVLAAAFGVFPWLGFDLPARYEGFVNIVVALGLIGGSFLLSWLSRSSRATPTSEFWAGLMVMLAGAYLCWRSPLFDPNSAIVIAACVVGLVIVAVLKPAIRSGAGAIPTSLSHPRPALVFKVMVVVTLALQVGQPMIRATFDALRSQARELTGVLDAGALNIRRETITKPLGLAARGERHFGAAA
jgi:hypothetical protein